jgi:Kef-type K+ transport system membrane component KefB
MDFLPGWPPEVNTLFLFGVLLVGGALGGYFAHRLRWLPSITGFMLVGLLVGPQVLGFIGPEGMAHAKLVVDVALALILYRLGLSLDIKALLADQRLLVLALAEGLASFVFIYAALGMVGISGVVAAVIAAIGISSSPAVLLHVGHELGASGPVSDRARALVALNNVMAFVAFSVVLPVLYQHNDAGWAVTLGAPAWRLLGSAALGAGLGWVLHWAARRTRRASQYHLALVIGCVMFALGGAQALKLSGLFAPLVLGVVVRSLEKETLLADLEFGAAFELFFIALFVYAGANLHLSEMWQYAGAATAFVLARSAAKLLAVTGVGFTLGVPLRQGATTGMLLLPMAGLAIGLTATTIHLFPEQGAVVSAVVLASVAFLETVGPPIAALAFRRSGDTLAADEAATPENQPQAGGLQHD